MLYLFSPEAEHKLKDVFSDLVNGQHAGDMPQVHGDCRCCVTQVWSWAQRVHKPPLGRSINGFIITTQTKKKHIHPPQPWCCACYLYQGSRSRSFHLLSQVCCHQSLLHLLVVRRCLLPLQRLCSSGQSHHGALWKQMSLCHCLGNKCLYLFVFFR